MGRKGWIIALLIVLAAIVGGAIVVRNRRLASSAEPPTTAVVTRGPLTQTVGGTGSLVPSRQVEASFANAGQVAEVLVETGAEVAEGDPLAVLDTRSLEMDVTSAESGLSAATSALASAQADLDVLEAGPDETDVATAQLSLESAKNSLWASQASRDGTCGRVKRGQGQQYECDGAEAAVNRGEASVQQAELELQKVMAGPTAQDLAAARQKVAQAKNSLVSAQNAVEEARMRLTQATLTSPISGTVTAVNIAPGEMSGSTAAVEVSDLSALDVEISLDETDVGSVEVGQGAIVTLDAFPEDQISGTVRSVSPVAQTESGVVLYPVTVSLAPSDVAVRPGMTADVEVVLDQVADALIVPLRAVVSGPNGAKFVMRYPAAGGSTTDSSSGSSQDRPGMPPEMATAVAEGTRPAFGAFRNGTPSAEQSTFTRRRTPVATAEGTPTAVTVEIGLTNDSDAQVLSGLNEGDVVLVQTTTSSNNTFFGRGPEGAIGGGIGVFRVP